jgi:hypothetical protein
MIVEYIRDISASLGGIRPLVPEGTLRTLHEKKDFVGMIRHIKNDLRLGMKLEVALVNNGDEPETPAWISIPHLMPLYGMPGFEDVLVTMHVQKSFLRESPLEAVVAVMAHELSHVVLKGIGHRLRQEEMAVDLTAMILGYRCFFRRGCEYETKYKASLLGKLFAFHETPVYEEQITTIHRIGYLAREEVVFAADFMDFRD